jgi:tetratricopeptide (TPR) repeat protein
MKAKAAVAPRRHGKGRPPQRHPTPAALARFARGTAGRRQARQVVAHLLAGCSECRRALAALAKGERGGAQDESARERAYRRAFARATVAARHRAEEMQQEDAASRGAMPRLSGQPQSRQLLLVRNSRSLRSWSACEILLAGGSSPGSGQPAARVAQGELALSVALDLEQERYGEGPLTDLRARAVAELARALQLAGRSDEARELLGDAFVLLEQGTGDPLVRARLYDVAASVLPAGEPPERAARYLERAFHLYRRFGDEHMAGRLLVKRATWAGLRGEPAGRLELLVEAAFLIDPHRDRLLAWTSIQNMLWGLVELRRYAAAEELLGESRYLAVEFDDGPQAHRLAWLEGRIAGGLGRAAAAEEKLLAACQGFLATGQVVDGLLVAMDLARLLVPQRRWAEGQLLFEGMLGRLRSGGMGREALAAVEAVRGALRRREVPLFLIDETARQLEGLQQEPRSPSAADG